jgi:hypothetical protein
MLRFGFIGSVDNCEEGGTGKDQRLGLTTAPWKRGVQGISWHYGKMTKYGWFVKSFPNPGYNSALPVVLFTSK